jgi:regulator of protease activity HflC (stomatin/prohibitin superfamily)
MQWTFILGVAVLFYLAGSIRVLRQYERGVVFLLGRFEGIRGPGLTLIFLPFQQMVRVSLRTVTMQIPSQKIITKDNVSIDIAAVAYYRISDPEKAVIAIENVYEAINQISQTTVRNVVGRFSLDQLLAETANINEQIKDVIDRHTEPWGTQVTAVEIKDIVLPDNMQRAMAREAEAERERRAKIVAAEGEYQAAVKLGEAADIITQHPVALQLRTLQTMAEISTDHLPRAVHDHRSRSNGHAQNGFGVEVAFAPPALSGTVARGGSGVPFHNVKQPRKVSHPHAEEHRVAMRLEARPNRWPPILRDGPSGLLRMRWSATASVSCPGRVHSERACASGTRHRSRACPRSAIKSAQIG